METTKKYLIDSSKVPFFKTPKRVSELIKDTKANFLLQNIATMYALTYDQIVIYGNNNHPEHEELLRDCIESVLSQKENFLNFSAEIVIYDGEELEYTPIEIISNNDSLVSLLGKQLNEIIINDTNFNWDSVKSNEDDFSNMISSIDLTKLPESEIDEEKIPECLPSIESRIDLISKDIGFQVFKSLLEKEGILDKLEKAETLEGFRIFLESPDGQKVLEEARMSVSQKIKIELDENFCKSLKASCIK